MKSLRSAITVTIVSLGILAGCGTPGQAQPETPSQIWHELVACARTHGDPGLPDPTIDDQGQAHFPPGTARPPAATLQACQSIYNRLPASVRGGGAPDIHLAIQFAQCMRAHGLTDWPDPNPDGSYPLPPDLQASMKSGPLWDRIKSGWDACRAFNPSGRISASHG